MNPTPTLSPQPDMVLVPREPTREMLNAAIDVDSFKLGDISPLGFRMSPQQLFEKCYAAMLAASPQPVSHLGALPQSGQPEPETAHATSPVQSEGLQAALPEGTPRAQWAAAGEPDPHGTRYDCERAALAMGDLSDDELANGAFLNYDRRPSYAELISQKPGIYMPIVWMTAVKDRIRWLSRALAACEASAGSARSDKAVLPANSALAAPVEAVEVLQWMGQSPEVVAETHARFAAKLVAHPPQAVQMPVGAVFMERMGRSLETLESGARFAINMEEFIADVRVLFDAAPQAVQEDERDAKRWRALVGCARISPLGSAGLEKDDPHAPDYGHLGLDLWTIHTGWEHGEAERATALRWLDRFIEKAERVNGLKLAAISGATTKGS